MSQVCRSANQQYAWSLSYGVSEHFVIADYYRDDEDDDDSHSGIRSNQ